MKFQVDAWDPGFGTSLDSAERGPAEASSATLDTDVEVPADQWRPIDPPTGLSAPERVLLVDGVRRTDARLWVQGGDGSSHPGLACSYAAGVVACQRGAAAVLDDLRVERALFTAAMPDDAEVNPEPDEIDAGRAVRYRVERIEGADEVDLSNGVQRALTELEIAVSKRSRTDGDLLIVDGPLRGRDALPRTLGYIKTQQKQYLPERLVSVVSQLRAGQRTPVFRISGVYQRFTWYLRLPGGGGSPWAGIVRVECSAQLPDPRAIALADMSTVTIPRFASIAYKDPRAPQNLIPIAGLEKRLRQRLGDRRILHRALLHAR